MKSVAFALLAFVALVQGDSCQNPKVTASTYTPADAQVLTHIPFVADFSLACSNGAKNVKLHADIPNVGLVPVIRVGNKEDSNKYQVSWTEDLKKAKTGEVVINLYDDEGYGAVKRAADRGEDAKSVKPFATVSIAYPGAFKGPWVNSELVAAGLAVVVFYFAFASKANILS